MFWLILWVERVFHFLVQWSSSTIVVNGRRQRSSSTVVDNGRRQQSSSTALDNNGGDDPMDVGGQIAAVLSHHVWGIPQHCVVGVAKRTFRIAVGRNASGGLTQVDTENQLAFRVSSASLSRVPRPRPATNDGLTNAIEDWGQRTLSTWMQAAGRWNSRSVAPSSPSSCTKVHDEKHLLNSTISPMTATEAS